MDGGTYTRPEDNASRYEVSTTASEHDSSTITWGNVLIGIVLYIVVLVTFFGNLVVLLAVYREKTLQTAFNFFIVNLAITDMLVAATAMSFHATDNMLGYWPFGPVLCGVWIFFDYGMTFASVFTLIAISADRYWSVFWSLSYRSVNKKKKSLLMILAVWSSMLALWIPSYVMDRVNNRSEENTCLWSPADNREFVVVIAVIGHHGPCVAMLTFYFKVFAYLRQRRCKLGLVNKNARVGPFKLEVSVMDTEAPSACTTDFVATSVGMNDAVDSRSFIGIPYSQGSGSKGHHPVPTATNDSPLILSASELMIANSTTTLGLSQQQEGEGRGAEGTSVDGVERVIQVGDERVRNKKGYNINFLETSEQKLNTNKIDSRRSRAMNPERRLRSKEKKLQNREVRVFTTLTYILMGYLICWVPFHVVFDISAVDESLVPATVYDVTFWMTYLNSTINPFLYNFSSPEFRHAFRKLMLRKSRRSVSLNSTSNHRTPSV